MNGRRSNAMSTPKSIPSLCTGQRFYDSELLDEGAAGRLYRQCVNALDTTVVGSQTAGVLRVRGRTAQIHAIYNGPRRLVRFWLRIVSDNRLVIVGNTDGLLPLDVEPIHG